MGNLTDIAVVLEPLGEGRFSLNVTGDVVLNYLMDVYSATIPMTPTPVSFEMGFTGTPVGDPSSSQLYWMAGIGLPDGDYYARLNV